MLQRSSPPAFGRGSYLFRPATLVSALLLLSAPLAAPLAAQGGGPPRELSEHQRIPGPYHPANRNNIPGLTSAAIDGDTMAVSAVNMAHSSGGRTTRSVGAVYILERRGPDAPWRGSAELRPSDPSAALYFGRQVVLDGDTLAVGAVGAVYVFERGAASGTWRQTRRISRDPLGLSIALDGDRLAIGEWPATVSGQTFAGRVDVYRRRGGAWSLEASLTDPAPAQQEALGKRVDLSGDMLVAYSADLVRGLRRPTVLVFRADAGGNWSVDARVRPVWGPGLPQTFRLSSIDLDGNTIVISGDTFVAVFERDPVAGWQQIQTIDTRVWGFPGNDRYQSLSGDRLAVSSHRRAYDGSGHVTLVFRRSGGRFVRQATLTQSDGFGIAVPRIDGDTVAILRQTVTSPCALTNPPTCGHGAIYIYDLDAAGTGYGRGCPGGFAQLLGTHAVPDFVATGTFTSGGRVDFHLAHARPNSVALLLLGDGRSGHPLGGGCLLRVRNTHHVIGPFPVPGVRGLAGSGAASFSLPVPSTAAGFALTAQAVIFDPASPNGIVTVSRGCEIGIR